jgi:electron transfer flavoprotein beta subunit
MEILVCVKQVLESWDSVGIDISGSRILIDPSASYRMNLFDEFAVEEALLIRERLPGTRVDVLSVGPGRAAMAARRAMGMGADRGIHIVTREETYTDPFVISSLIARYAEGRQYRLILTGVMAEDDLQGMVGPMTAQLLSLPCATAAVRERISEDRSAVLVERELEGGFREELDVRLPALLTIQSGINRPRYPSLSNLLRAKGAQLESVQADALCPPENRQEVIRPALPEKSRAALFLEGTTEEKAEGLVGILRQAHLL